MFKKSIASVVSAVLLVAGPGHMILTASAQTVTRGAVTGVTVIPAIGADLNSPIPTAFSFNTPSILPGALTAPGLLAAPSIAAPAPVAAAALPQAIAATPVLPMAAKDSPFSVIESRDPAVDVSKKAVALGELFDNSIRTGAETIEVLGQSATPAKQSSGRPWSKTQIATFVKEHGKAISAVPGVRKVSVGYGVAGPSLAFLIIVVDESKTIADVKKAVETQVPAISGLYGILGAPNQVQYEHPSAAAASKGLFRLTSRGTTGSLSPELLARLQSDPKIKVIQVLGTVVIVEADLADLKPYRSRLYVNPASPKQLRGPAQKPTAAQPSGALAPDETDAWRRSLLELLRGADLAVNDVNFYADVPPGLNSGPNVVSITMFGNLAKAYGLLEGARKPFTWLRGMTFEFVVGHKIFRASVPFPGQEVAAETHQVLRALGDQKIATYMPVTGIPPFPGALKYGQAKARNFLGLHGLAGWQLNRRAQDPQDKALDARNYYLLWTGPVAASLEAPAAFERAALEKGSAVGALKPSDRLKTALTKIASYYEKEGVEKTPLSDPELRDLTTQLNYISGLPDGDIRPYLGHLQGVSIVIRDFLKARKNPNETVKAALKAAEKLLTKVVAIPS